MVDRKARESRRRWQPQHAVVECCGKVAYTSLTAALTARVGMALRHGAAYRAYRCSLGAWHLVVGQFESGGQIYAPPLVPISGLPFPNMVSTLLGIWLATSETAGPRYICGHCGAEVGPSRRYRKEEAGNFSDGSIFLCPVCNRPTFISTSLNEQVPGPLVGRSIASIGDAEVEKLYNEARKALANDAPSASVMVCRKLLMHIAVEQGAHPGKNFAYYTKYLEDEGTVGKPFAGIVDHIRKAGNKENHELDVSTVAEATMLLKLVEFVLASIYELPGMVPKPTTP